MISRGLEEIKKKKKDCAKSLAFGSVEDCLLEEVLRL